jgi:hypothetical protein
VVAGERGATTALDDRRERLVLRDEVGAAVTVLSVSLTRDGARPYGPTTTIPAFWNVSTTT